MFCSPVFRLRMFAQKVINFQVYCHRAENTKEISLRPDKEKRKLLRAGLSLVTSCGMRKATFSSENDGHSAQMSVPVLSVVTWSPTALLHHHLHHPTAICAPSPPSHLPASSCSSPATCLTPLTILASSPPSHDTAYAAITPSLLAKSKPRQGNSWSSILYHVAYI